MHTAENVRHHEINDGSGPDHSNPMRLRNSCHCRCATNRMPCQTPQHMYRMFPLYPGVMCQAPKTSMAITSEKLRHQTSRRMVARGRKRKSRIQNESDICQRVQNSEIVVDR